MVDPVTLSTFGDSFTLADGETIADAAAVAQITVSALNTTLNINGTVTGTNRGISVGSGASSAITVGATGIIQAPVAIQLNGGLFVSNLSEVSLVNAGQIRTTGSNSSAVAINTGSFSTGRITSLVNQSTGLIQGVAGFVDSINNAGVINGGASNALRLTGNVVINNSGTINAAPSSQAFLFATNTIQVSPASGAGSTSLLTLTNSGTINAPTSGSAGRAIQASSAIITNSVGGTISAFSTSSSAILAQLQLSLVNDGLISGQIQGGDSATVGDGLTNNGTINGALLLRAGNDSLINRGVLNGAVDLGDGNDVFNGIGGTLTDQVTGGLGDDSFSVDVATIGAGTLAPVVERAGEGTDIVLATVSYALGDNIENLTLLADGGAINGTGNMLANILTGNASANTLIGGGGADIFVGGAGNDRLILGSGASGSSIDGGADTDTLVVNNSLSSLASISGIEAVELVGGANLTLTGTQIDTGLSYFTTVSGQGSITVNMDAAPSGYNLVFTTLYTFAGPEVSMVINGTTGINVIKLGASLNTVNGGASVDQIRGGSLVDIINGNEGGDKIWGLGGADIITTGSGNDQLRYARASESGLGALADVITDFSIGSDRLVFVQIDADAATAGDQAFSFVGTGAFTATGTGQIRYGTSGSDIIVQADVNGDGNADMEIILQGLNGQTLTAADFVL
jgi:hypothetical protein